MDTRDAGRKGGKAGRGEAKRRGDSAYYKALRAKRSDIYGEKSALKVHIPSHSDCDCQSCRPWTF